MRRDFLSLKRTRSMIKKTSYARRLRIDLASKNEEELFKWFLACLLFGKPIQTEIAERAYQELVAARLTSPNAVLRAGWDKTCPPVRSRSLRQVRFFHSDEAS